MEKDILEKATEILKKDEGIGIDTLSNREKAMVIDALTCRYPIKHLPLSLHMAKSSHFYQCHAMKRDKYGLVRKELGKTFAENRQCYGYRRPQRKEVQKSLDNQSCGSSYAVAQMLSMMITSHPSSPNPPLSR